jgi:stage V sporulation protein G
VIQISERGTKELAMQLSEIRINLTGPSAGRLKAFCSLTFDNTFVIRDVKLIEGNDGLFLAMPSRKLCDHCPGCREKNHLRARFCNNCGVRLDENRHSPSSNGNGHSSRLKLHADIAHPINAESRLAIERRVLSAYREELERSKQPGYVPPKLDSDLGEGFDFEMTADSGVRLRPTGTSH